MIGSLLRLRLVGFLLLLSFVLWVEVVKDLLAGYMTDAMPSRAPVNTSISPSDSQYCAPVAATTFSRKHPDTHTCGLAQTHPAIVLALCR